MLFRLFSCACVVVGLGMGSSSTYQIVPQPTYTHWVLTTLDGKPLPASRVGTQPFLVLPADGEPQQNPYKGSFQPPITERLRHLPRVISAMMRSNDEAIETELRYLSVLEETTRFEIANNTLLLYAARQSTPVATFTTGRPL
ncbi:META domain-containing protein [Hymenobacter sp. HD11105]